VKIRIERISNIAETEVIIKCRENSPDAERVAGALRLLDKAVTGKKENRTYAIPAVDIYYFECADDKIFCNTAKEVYETSYRLYELEELFAGSSFLRVNKYLILSADKIQSFRSALNGRMEAILKNGEKVEISRNYVPALKLLLGGKR